MTRRRRLAPSSQRTPGQPVGDLLSGLHLAPRQAYKALTVWPLLREAGAASPGSCACVTTLAAAVDRGACVVEDASGAAASPRVRIENLGSKAILVTAGDEIPGAVRKWRALRSYLVAPGGHVVIDAALGCRAARRRPLDLADTLESFHTLEGQVGFVAAIGDDVVGLECLASPHLLRRLFARLLEAHAAEAARADWRAEEGGRLDAMERRLRFSAPEPFLRALSHSRCWRVPSVGMGQSLEAEGPGVAARALAAGPIVHLSAVASAITARSAQA